MKDEEEKEEVLAWLRLAAEKTNIQQVLRDIGINSSSFYGGKYSLESMLKVKTELQKRMKELSKM